jgi:hypothetical protein
MSQKAPGRHHAHAAQKRRKNAAAAKVAKKARRVALRQAHEKK